MLHLYFYGLSTSIFLSDTLVYSKPINKYVSFYIEKDKHFSVNDIIDLDSIFLPSKNEALNFSYFDDHVWLKLTLNSAKKESLYLEYGPYWADSIQLFCVSKDSIY